MSHPPTALAQVSPPEFLPDLLALGGAIVLLLMLAAIAGIVYKSLTGGIEWPEDEPEEEDALRRGDQDDEWDYY